MSDKAGVELRQVSSADTAHLDQIRTLFSEYADSLDVDLSFQNFKAELDALPSGYLPPDGALILALRGADALGCIGVRRLQDQVCEMKRLYVRDSARGDGVGLALCRAAMEAGKTLGYARMRLDTLPSMAAARALYRRLGFVEIEPYYHNPIKGTSFMECVLSDNGSKT